VFNNILLEFYNYYFIKKSKLVNYNCTEAGEIPMVQSDMVSQAAAVASLVMSQLTVLAASQGAGLSSSAEVTPKQYMDSIRGARRHATISTIQRGMIDCILSYTLML